MAKNTKSETYPDEEYRTKALKSGRGKLTEVSMKALGTPDTRLQARVQHLDLDHVRRLDGILQEQGRLGAIVVFRDAEGRLYLADGFHRHEAYRRAGLPAIPGVVIDGTYEEAAEYAAMCNQLTLLPRKREDIRKAAWMLLGLPGWAEKSASMIGKKIGVSPATASRYVLEWSLENGVSLSETVVNSDKSRTPRSYPKRTGEHSQIRRRPDGGFAASVNGREVYLGRDEAKAKARLAEMIAVRVPNHPATLAACFASRGVSFSPVRVNRVGASNQIGAASANGLVFAAPSGVVGAADLLLACSRAMFAAAHVGSRSAFVLIDGRHLRSLPHIIEIGKSLGIQFLTIDEFVSLVKSSEADSPKRDTVNLASGVARMRDMA